MPIDKGILEEYVATANSGKYKSFAEINEKFPELKDYDANVLEEYVATSNSGKYKSWDEINGKFPELFSDPVKKKEPLALGFESASEASRIGGLQKPETVSQSPLKSPSVSKPTSALEGIQGVKGDASTEVVAPNGETTSPQPRLSAEEQQSQDIAATKGYVGQETQGTQLDVILANQKTPNVPLDKQMTSKDIKNQLDLLTPSTQGVEANEAFESIFKKEGRDAEISGIDETEFKKYLSGIGIADKYNNARMEYDLSEKERYSIIQKYNQSVAGIAVNDLNITKARLTSNPAFKEYEALREQASALQKQIGAMGIDENIAKHKSNEEIEQYNGLINEYNNLNQQANMVAQESGITNELQELEEYGSNYSSSLIRSRLLVDKYPNILKEQQLQEKADAEYEVRRAKFKSGDLTVLPTSAMYVGASAVNALNRNFYNSLASLIDNFGKLNDNTYSLGDWASKGLTDLASNAIITPHKEFSKSGYNIDGYIVTKDKNGSMSVYDKDFTPVKVDQNLATKFDAEYDKKQNTGAEKEVMYDFFSLTPQMADQFVTMYSLVGGGRLVQNGLQSLTKRAISQNAGMTASSYLMTYEDYKNTAKEKGLSDVDSHLFASISAMTTSLLEGISPNSNLIPKGQTAKALEAFTASVGAPIKTRVKNVSKALIVEPSKEITQEISQIGGDILVETGANAVLGKDVFDAATDMDEIRNTAVLTYGTTALAQLPTSQLFNTKDKKEWWQWASKDVDKLITQVEEDVQNGLYSEEKAQLIIDKANSWAATQGRIPAETEDVKRAQITPLLLEKKDLLENSKDLDKVFQDETKKRIDAIDNEIIGIMNRPIEEFTQPTNENQETQETPSSETVTDTIVSDGSATPTTVESTEVAPRTQTLSIETPSINIAVAENPYNKSLRQLGYSDADIEKMSIEQKQNIAENKTQAPIVESSAKVDSIKENAKQERIAEMQKQLDDEAVSETVSDIEPPVVEQTTTDVGGVTAPDVSEAGNVGVGGDVKQINILGSDIALDKPQRKDFTDGEIGDLEYANANMEHNKRVDEIIIGLNQDGTLKDNQGNEYIVSITNQGVRIVNKMLDGTEGPNFYYRKGKRVSKETPFTNGFSFKPKSATKEQVKENKEQPSESARKSDKLAVSRKERITERKAIAEAKVDEVADKLKAFLRNNNLPEGTKTSGVNQDKIIDVLASTVKALVNSGIEINDAIAKVREYLNEEYDTSGIEDYEIKQSIARDELTDYAKEQGFTSYRNAVFAVNKYVRPVSKEDVIAKEDIDKAKEAKAEASKEDEAPKGQTLSGRSKSYEEKRVPVSEQYREAVNAKQVFYQAEGLQSFADAAIEYLADFGDSIQGLNNAYDDMVKVYNDNPYYRAYNSIAIELLSDRIFAEGEKANLNGDKELANQLFTKSDNLRVMAFNAARKAGQYNAALAIFSSSRNPDAFAMFVNKEINKEADKIRAIKQPKIDEGVKEFKSKVRKAQTEAANEAVKSAPRKQAVRTNKFSELKERGVKRQKEALSKLKKLGFLGSNGLNNEAIEAIGELIVAQLEIGVYKAANIIQRIKAMTNGNVTDEHIKETYDKYKIKYEGNEYSLTELSDLLNKQEQAELLQSDPEKYIEQQAKEKLSAGKGKQLTLSELLERDLVANETAEGISKNIQKEFGLSEKEANLIANKFYDKYKYLLKSKIEKALMSSLGIKNVKEIDRRESAGEIKPFEKTLGGKIVAEVLAGALDSSQTIEDAFSVKYGIPVMTPTIRDNIRQLSKRVNAATTILGQRTANRSLISYIQEQLPTSAGSVLKTAYYVSLLSGVSTAAVNTWGNVNTLVNQAIGENFVQSIIEAFQGNKANLVSSVQGKAKLRAATTNMNRALVAFTDIMARGGGENKYYNLNQKAINEFDSERLILKKQDLKNLGLNRLAAALGKLYYTAPAIINRNLSASDEAFYSLNYNVEATREIRKKLYKETDLRGKALEDAVFQQVYGTKEIMLEAMVQAEKEMLNIGMTPSSNKKLAKRIAYELISRKLDKEVQNTAEKIAAENTYRGELRGAMGYIGTVVPQMALITPFVNTVVKIAEKHMNYIPVYGMARTLGFSLTDNLRAVKDINDYFERKGIEKTKRTGELRNKQIAQVILSHSLLGVFYALSQMSWTDDDDKKEKPLLEVSGGYIGMPYAKQQQGRELMPEYTLRIKDFKINYKNNPLLAMICLPLAVKMDNDRMGLKTERPINSYSFALSMYLYDAVPIKNIQEFFTSLAKTTDKFSDVEPENMVKEVVKSFAMIPANLLAPNTYKQIFDYMNPQKYQTNDYKDGLWKAINMEKIGALIPTYDMWGKPVKMYPGETFMPIQYILRDDKDDDVTQWAVSKNISLPSLNRKTLVLDLDSKTGYTKKEWDKKQVRDNAEFLTVEMQELAQKANFRVLTYSEWAEMDATIRNNVYQIISRNLDKVGDNDEMIEMLNVIEVPLNDMTSIKANKAVDVLFELERQKYIKDKFLTGLEDDNTN